MLEQAGKRFSGDERVTLIDHNMDDPLPDLLSEQGEDAGVNAIGLGQDAMSFGEIADLHVKQGREGQPAASDQAGQVGGKSGVSR